MTDTAGASLPAVEATAPEQGTQAANARALAAVPMPVPGERGPMTRPTERPNEPITAGLSSGPGRGPRSGLSELDRVMAIYQAHPNEGLRRIIEHLQRQGIGNG